VQEERFKAWLVVERELNAGTIGSRISNCKRVEHYEGDLDTHYDADGLVGLMDRLNPRRPEHKIPINGNVYNGTATLKSAVGLYRGFRDAGGVKADSAEAPSKRHPQVRRTRSALSDDLILIELKYAWNCETCGTRLPAGRQAYWSPKARGRVWCLTCLTQENAVVPNRDFRDAGGVKADSAEKPQQAKQRSQAQRTRQPGADWPVWPTPSDEDLRELARAMTPFVRFLDPGIVYAVAEDNRRMGGDWSSRLEALGIDSAIYLWEGSPCAFPGVRRYAGSTEIAVFRQRATANEAPRQCLALDDNDYPKHLWAFAFIGKPFRKRGPDGYQLAHLHDHKEHGNRWREELDIPPGAKEPEPPYGLFTSAANSAYVPGAFLRPTDLSPRLRSLIQRRALQLYGNICCIVPPPFAVKPCEDPNWSLDSFQWSTPVGGMDNVPAFLEFRRERMEELFDKRHAALRTDGTS